MTGNTPLASACAAIRLCTTTASGSAASAESLVTKLTIRISAPYVPSRLSRMISSFAAGSRPPPKPSATSASPSSCSAPVRIALAPKASAADRGAHQRKHPVRADKIRRHRPYRMRHRQPGQECDGGSKVVEPVIHGRESEGIIGSRRTRQGNRMQFDSLDDIRAFCRDLPGGDVHAAGVATLRQQSLTKPPGSLGRLEQLAIWLARWQRREIPQLDRVTIEVFAGNHGIAARGVSAYQQAVTAQMVANFANGGAAINQIAKLSGADLRVVPIELDRPTRDFTAAPAMDIDEFLTAVDIGY